MQEKEKDPSEEASGQFFSGIAPGEIVIGVVGQIDAAGQPVVEYPENPTDEPLVAVSTLSITHQHVGRQVALLFVQGDMRRPVIVGLIHNPLYELIDNFELNAQGATPGAAKEPGLTQVDDVKVDGKRVVLEGEEEIVLKCGEASITLTRAGKILIRGKYLLNRSAGVNRIMGGSVQVN